jgi:hypothetical protein
LGHFLSDSFQNIFHLAIMASFHWGIMKANKTVSINSLITNTLLLLGDFCCCLFPELRQAVLYENRHFPFSLSPSLLAPSRAQELKVCLRHRYHCATLDSNITSLNFLFLIWRADTVLSLLLHG